ncbi:MAG: YebC/PmpR family DNA-binding transcriptional regulator [Deltaproteobacteria bacterium]|nr:YebC/PmpR family DNA-binding transcriptional regulator [Deltaproteobacteria bacterium]
MGRTFENRKHAMAKRGDRDAKAFTRAGRHIAMAVRAGGGDPDGNPALRRAIQNARAVSMPKDRIQAAIDKATGVGDAEAFQSILYEGYGPHGVAILVDTATDNPTRTVANVRLAFKKGNGNLGNSGSVSFLFDHFGFFRLSPDGIDREELELEFIDHGLEQLVEGEADDGSPVLVLRCSRENFGKVQSALEQRGIEPVSSGFEWIPKDTTTLPEEQAEEVIALIERLEQDDDVQQVFATLD